ncbi:MAG: potassium transporter Kup [Pseudobdellovibrionaceae bacterium]
MENSVYKKNLLLLCLGALGVVFGDIGTSPLYALRECFSHELGLAPTHENIIGVLSLIFWTLTLVISFNYMIFVMRADNKGEGGILSLMALAVRSLAPHLQNSKRRWVMTILGLFGAALLYGDGVITPAISVLSAVEGLKYITPVFEPFVVPITLLVLAGLFLVQRYGTGRIGVVFGPIILIWFVVLGGLGISGIINNPTVIESLNPWHAIEFFIINKWHGFFVLGAVFLVVTGGEALYADMGHFGRKPIRLTWYFIAMPALTLNYLGQGALLLAQPETISSPFYLLAPDWARPALVLLSTMATVIASQALISGVFSITRQAVQLGFCPRLSIVHTSRQEIGQIYVPFVNGALFVGVVWLVVTFKSSSSLAAAYGIAVTGTMVITTILAYLVARQKWHWGIFKALSILGFFLILNFAFFGANALKVFHGGWVPLVIGAVICLLMTTWQTGRRILYNRLKAMSLSVEDFCQKILKDPPLRVPGTAIYMSGDPWGIPVPLLHNLKHNKVMHERVALLTIVTQEIPIVQKTDRIQLLEIIPNVYRIVAQYGFMETPKMKHILEALRQHGINFNVSEITFVLGRETILPSGHPGMALWREKIFAVMSRNAQRPTAFFKIPPNQVIEVGIQIEI